MTGIAIGEAALQYRFADQCFASACEARHLRRRSYPTDMRLALAAIAFVTAFSGAKADSKLSDATMMQRVLKKIEQDNRECNVGFSYAGRIAAGTEASSRPFDGALVLIYSVDGCNGGNNWRYTAQVYGLKDDAAVEISPPQSWSIVKGADFNGNRALIYAVTQGPNDGHCCPTEGKTIEVTVSDGKAIFRQIKAWFNRD